MVKAEITTKTGARIELMQHRPITETDSQTGAVDLSETFLMHITLTDPQDFRVCEVLLTQYELEQLGSVIDMLKYLY